MIIIIYLIATVIKSQTGVSQSEKWLIVPFSIETKMKMTMKTAHKEKTENANDFELSGIFFFLCCCYYYFYSMNITVSFSIAINRRMKMTCSFTKRKPGEDIIMC